MTLESLSRKVAATPDPADELRPPANGERIPALQAELAACTDPSTRDELAWTLADHYFHAARPLDAHRMFAILADRSALETMHNRCVQAMAFIAQGLDPLPAEDDRGAYGDWLLCLALALGSSGNLDVAVHYAERSLAISPESDDQARACLLLGQIAEKRSQWDVAITAYLRGCALEAGPAFTRYFLRNNLGYSLLQMGLHREAESHCRMAIALDPDRHNAHKNLGLSLRGQGKFVEAGESLLAAAHRYPQDGRALAHFHEMLQTLAADDEAPSGDRDALERMLAALAPRDIAPTVQ